MADFPVLPSYPQPCLASTNNSSAVYLIGTPIEGGIFAHTISLANINAPVVTNTFHTGGYNVWVHDAPKACSMYLGRSLSDPFTVHIQQLGRGSSWDTNFYSNGTFKVPTNFEPTYFLTKQTYAYIAQAGDNTWALTSTSNKMAPWGGMQLDARNGSFNIGYEF